jgi:hypothetical protein
MSRRPAGDQKSSCMSACENAELTLPTYCVEKLGFNLKANWPPDFSGPVFVCWVLFFSGQSAQNHYQAGIISTSVLLGTSHLAIRLRF